MSICLVLALVMSLVASASHPSLSSYVGVEIFKSSPRLVSSCRRKTTSCDDAGSAMYSASAVESATELWSLLAHATADPHIMATYPVLDLLASPSPKEEYCHLSRFCGNLRLRVSECLGVPER